MNDFQFLKTIQLVFGLTVGILLLTLLIGISATLYFQNPKLFTEEKQIVVEPPVPTSAFSDSIHTATGFIQGEHLDLVIATCTGCHSSKLIIQNRATKEGWKSMILWMQQTQNLPDLGENEEKIIAYLATHYAPEEQGRRKPLTEIEWYTLE